MPLERQCCMAGMQESPMGHTCEKRVHRVHQGPSCRAAFLDCCRLSQDLSQEERAQLLLGKCNGHTWRGGRRAGLVGIPVSRE